MANSLPFNAVAVDGEYDRVYKAEDWAWYFATFIANGIFPKPSDGLQVVAYSGMEIRVNAGYAFINGYAFRNPATLSVTLDTAEGALNRVDRVVVRWDLPQPEQMEQEIDEAVSEALSSYQFSADNFNSMTSVLRGIGEQGDKSIVTVSSGKQDTDIFGNPVENTGDYAGAVIAESDGEFLIFTYADAVRAADSINVRFSDGTKIAGTVRQIDEVLGMAVVAVPSGNLPEEERKKVQVLSLANSYTVKAGDVLVGIGGPSGQVHSLSFGTVSYVARNVQITDGLTRILYADISSNSQTGTFLINTAGEMVGWTSESCRSESCTDRTAAYTISSYKPILERLTNGASAAYLGILGQDVSRAMQGSGIPAGVYVTEAVSGSPAYDAGIQPGDIIVKFGTKEIGSFKDLQAQIENSASGVSVSVNVMRKGRDGYTEIPFLVSLRAR